MAAGTIGLGWTAFDAWAKKNPGLAEKIDAKFIGEKLRKHELALFELRSGIMQAEGGDLAQVAGLSNNDIRAEYVRAYDQAVDAETALRANSDRIRSLSRNAQEVIDEMIHGIDTQVDDLYRRAGLTGKPVDEDVLRSLGEQRGALFKEGEKIVAEELRLAQDKVKDLESAVHSTRQAFNGLSVNQVEASRIQAETIMSRRAGLYARIGEETRSFQAARESLAHRALLRVLNYVSKAEGRTEQELASILKKRGGLSVGIGMTGAALVIVAVAGDAVYTTAVDSDSVTTTKIEHDDSGKEKTRIKDTTRVRFGGLE
jgi:hypothetical protein